MERVFTGGLEDVVGIELDEILGAEGVDPDAAQAFVFGAAEFSFDFGGDLVEGAHAGFAAFEELDEDGPSVVEEFCPDEQGVVSRPNGAAPKGLSGRLQEKVAIASTG